MNDAISTLGPVSDISESVRLTTLAVKRTSGCCHGLTTGVVLVRRTAVTKSEKRLTSISIYLARDGVCPNVSVSRRREFIQARHTSHDAKHAPPLASNYLLGRNAASYQPRLL